jgi:uncharacterized protein YndB with AHSA1/START domain
VGTYLEVQRPRRLVFTWGIAGESVDESHVAVQIAPLPSGCEVTLTHTLHPQWADFAERTRQGWDFMLGKLEQMLAQD